MKNLFLMTAISVVSLSSAFALEPVKLKVVNGLVTCNRTKDDLSIRFIPHLRQLEVKNSNDSEFKACKPLANLSKDIPPTPTESLEAINQRFLEAGPRELAGLWRSQKNLRHMNFSYHGQRLFIHASGYDSFDCGGKKTITFIEDSYVESSSNNQSYEAKTSFGVVDNNLNYFARIESQILTAQRSGPLKEHADWTCSDYDPNFVGNVIGPRLENLDRPYILFH